MAKLNVGPEFQDVPLTDLFETPEPAVYEGPPGVVIPPTKAERLLINPTHPLDMPAVREMLPEDVSEMDTRKRPTMVRLLREGCRYIALRYLPEAMKMLEDPTVPKSMKVKLFDIVLTAALANTTKEEVVLNADGNTETVIRNPAVIALPSRVDAADVLADGAALLHTEAATTRPADALQALARKQLMAMDPSTALPEEADD